MALPCEMIAEILCRLPVKPLLRFRCVSKEWCSLIDSNAFAKKQIKNALDCNAGVGVMISKLDFGGEKRVYLAGFDSLDDESVSVVEIDGPLKAFLSVAHVVGSSNGLMCVIKYVTKDVFLLNPTTRKTRKIACAPPEFPRSFRMGDSHFFGFGYDEVSDDFKVVLIAKCYRQFHGLIAVVYSCKTNAWTRVQDVPSNIQLLGTMGLFASGSLQWRATTIGKIRKHIIVAFDLQRQLFKEVPFSPTETCADFNYLVNAGNICVFLNPLILDGMCG
ncbi:hypothetical protein DCAR_0310001 [Daucus carota subsp. sativus]|uniref:F-box domain-containing protein n=1 Tax=Daucus carota subsp. sativus TaxID=79200 RepID=A0AAF0WIZ0_DAUCS|nr:PREDICTED: F-box/kelch-repeat protein At3g06240-like [Daucus carota subsp. sativus]WOG90757.1 hypothetical protein DCAR_0310001 [Daucus carota subsp. sativus]